MSNLSLNSNYIISGRLNTYNEYVDILKAGFAPNASTEANIARTYPLVEAQAKWFEHDTLTISENWLIQIMPTGLLDWMLQLQDEFPEFASRKKPMTLSSFFLGSRLKLEHQKKLYSIKANTSGFSGSRRRNETEFGRPEVTVKSDHHFVKIHLDEIEIGSPDRTTTLQRWQRFVTTDKGIVWVKIWTYGGSSGLPITPGNLWLKYENSQVVPLLLVTMANLPYQTVGCLDNQETDSDDVWSAWAEKHKSESSFVQAAEAELDSYDYNRKLYGTALITSQKLLELFREVQSFCGWRHQENYYKTNFYSEEQIKAFIDGVLKTLSEMRLIVKK